MKLAFRLGLAALVAAALAGAASSATAPPRIVEAGGVTYPQRAYILSLPYAKSLSTSDVNVTENGGPVSSLALGRQGTDKGNTGVVIAIDESLTMKGKPIQDALAAARAFALGASPYQQIAVVTFNGSVNVQRPLSSSPSAIDASLSGHPQVAYGTKNYDALAQSLKLITDAGLRSGSVILLTDGQNVGSVAKPADVLAALKQAHVRVFSVGLESPAYDARTLQQIAAETGGTYVKANTPSKLKPLLVSLGRQLAREYLVTYTTQQNPGTKVLVAMKVNGVPGVARSAYTTPKLAFVPAPPYKPSVFDRTIQSRYLMIGVALLLAVLFGFAVSHAAATRSDPLVTRVGSFVAVEQPSIETEAQKKERQTARAILTRMSASVSRATWSSRLESSLELADIDMDPLQLVVLTTICTLLAMLVFGMAIGIIGVLAALSVPFIVRQLIRSRISRKRRMFAEQLPDNLDVLASALRAGHSLVGALTVVADDATEPSKAEFQRVLAEEQFGVNLEDALQIAVTRMENSDLDQVALVARLQREVGSNSAEVLDKVIETVRARMELRRLVRTLTAQGRFSRWILTLLPIGLAILLTIIGGSYMHPLFHETLGRVLLVVAAIMVVAGSYIIGRIVEIRV